MFGALCVLVQHLAPLQADGADSAKTCGCCSDVGEGPRWEHLKLVHSMAGELRDFTSKRDREDTYMLVPVHGAVNPSTTFVACQPADCAKQHGSAVAEGTTSYLCWSSRLQHRFL